MYGLNNNFNVRYNPDTDKIQVLYNGAWTDSLDATIKSYKQYITYANQTSDFTYSYDVGRYNTMLLTWLSYSGSQMNYSVYGGQTPDNCNTAIRNYGGGVNSTTLDISAYKYIKLRISTNNYTYNLKLDFSV